MRTASRVALTAALSLILPLLLSSACAAAPEIAFETVTLRNLTAGEIAPLLGSDFKFLGRSPLGMTAPTAGGLSAFVPEGITLLTAGSQLSRNLLVAGTAKGVAELRGLISLLDVRPASIQAKIAVFPSGPTATRGWREVAATDVSGLHVTVMLAEKGQAAPPLVFPAAVKPYEAEFTLAHVSEEFVALPAYGNWRQAILALTPRVNGDGTVTISIKVGSFDDQSKPEEAVRQAHSASACIVNVKPGDLLGMVLTRGERSVSVLLELATG